MAKRKVTRTVWVNLYEMTDAAYFFDSEEAANFHCSLGRVNDKAFKINIKD